jgi:hypothetical protein
MSIYRLFKLSITFSCSLSLLASETTKATRWVALVPSRYAARDLGHRPRNEGWHGDEAVVVDARIGARRPRRGSRRLGEEQRGVGMDQHDGVGPLAGRRIEHGADVRKGRL